MSSKLVQYTYNGPFESTKKLVVLANNLLKKWHKEDLKQEKQRRIQEFKKQQKNKRKQYYQKTNKNDIKPLPSKSVKAMKRRARNKKQFVSITESQKRLVPTPTQTETELVSVEIESIHNISEVKKNEKRVRFRISQDKKRKK